MKNGIVILILAVILVVTIGVFVFNFDGDEDAQPSQNESDVKSLSYSVNGEIFTLKDGKAENELVPGSATKNKLSIFGEPVYGDLDADGDEDAAILLANDPGGSGIFYYAALAIKNGTTYQVTPAMFLGDRIAPQTVEIHDGHAVFNFAERKAGESLSTPPSIGKSVWVHYDQKTGEIGEWVKDLEGESAIPRP
ncbi:MAG: hypothetical protein G01um101420_849 [Parcubacteria group bacterium Gr01-1014_20]|nr:MAG: hypothetical protein G01um101420_849 [Parcubacteria group bacterium Gr01-1014_20]